MYLQSVTKPLLGESALQGAAYGSEFFDRAMMHPAISELARSLYAGADRSAPDRAGGDPVSDVLKELDSLLSFCHGHCADST